MLQIISVLMMAIFFAITFDPVWGWASLLVSALIWSAIIACQRLKMGWDYYFGPPPQDRDLD